jgi:hypothetical protein
MRGRILVLLTFAGACAASAPSHQSERVELAPPSIDSVPDRQEKPRVDLSGAWVTGSTNEPAVRHFVLQLQCNHTPSFWAIDQRGDSVWAYTIPESHAQGIARPMGPRPVTATGRISGVEVTLRIGSTRYVLRYDETSGHLRGTLNGAPFWAVRQQQVQAEDCIPVP